MARKIPSGLKTFESFLDKIDTAIPADPITINELKETFFFLKTNKSPDHDEISSNVIKNCFSELNDTFQDLFKKSIEKRVFLDTLKIARVTPLFKGGDPSDISN